MARADYGAKLAAMAGDTLLPRLESDQARFVQQMALRYRFTFQDLRRVAQAARDLAMWREEPLSTWWLRVEDQVSVATGRERKKAMLNRLDRHLADLAAAEKVYPEGGPAVRKRRPIRLVESTGGDKVVGLCPAYSEHTVCCGLHTLDAVRGCPFSCSYCTIQTFYGDTAELEVDLLQKLESAPLDPGRRYHIGTGQASDSLVWGNRGGILEALAKFAASHPNVLLELKTKSDNIGALANLDLPPNLVCSWTLNTDTIIRNEEAGAAALANRLRAARKMADLGVPVAFHFHPMVYYAGWDDDYVRLAQTLMNRFSPAEVLFISMGTVTLIKPVVQEIRRRGEETRILQMQMVPDHHGKLTYPDAIKVELFQSLYGAFSPWSGKVFFYLCMETAAIWRRVLGFAYPTNRAFESDFLDRCLRSRASGRPDETSTAAV